MVELTHDWVIAMINIDDGVVVDTDDMMLMVMVMVMMMRSGLEESDLWRSGLVTSCLTKNLNVSENSP